MTLIQQHILSANKSNKPDWNESHQALDSASFSEAPAWKNGDINHYTINLNQSFL